jgi:hypothetical protein
MIKATLVAANPLPRKEKLTATLDGRGVTADQTWQLEVGAGGTAQREISVRLGDNIAVGQHVFALRSSRSDGPDGSDSFLVVDVQP